MKKLSAVGAIVGALLLSAFAKEKTVYREEFDHLGDYVEAFSEDARISEAPGSLKSLFFSPKESTLVREGYFSIQRPPESDSYVIHFSFQLPGKERAFAFYFYFDDGNKRMLPIVQVTIAEKGSYFGLSNKLPEPKDGMAGFLGGWNWNKGAIVVKSGRAELYLYRNGILTKEAEGIFPKGRLIGWNAGSKETLGLDHITVVDGSERPYGIGDPVSWLADFEKERAAGDDVALPKSSWQIQGETDAVLYRREPEEDLCLRLQCNGDSATKRQWISLELADGTKETISVCGREMSRRVTFRNFDATAGEFKNVATNVVIPEAYQEISWTKFRMNRNVAPVLQWRYEEPEIMEIVANSEKLPRISEHPLEIRIRHLEQSGLTNEVWIGGNYAGKMNLSSPIHRISAKISTNAVLHAYRKSDMATAFAGSRYLPLDVDALNRPYGTVPAPVGLPVAGAVPYLIARPSRALNLAYCRENQGSFMLECNGYLSRNAFDGMPSSMHFSVPVAQYIHAYALCAVDPNAPEDFIPTVTARLTQYHDNGGRSQAACESTRRLPMAEDEELPDGVILYGEAEGGVKLYSVRFDFDIGSIQDLTSMLNLNNLDLDFIGALWEKDNYYLSRKRAPSHERQSSVQIYAATLEKAPAEMVVTPNRNNSTYYPNEQAGAKISVKPLDDNAGTFNVVINFTNAKDETLSTTNFVVKGTSEKTIDFSFTEYGHYGVTYSLFDGDGNFVMAHRGSFVLLPQDTRKAGYDSPYYVWNFGGAHGTPSKVEDFGDILKRMGVRRTLLSDQLCETNELVKSYMLTKGEFPFMMLRKKGGQSDEEAFEDLKAQMRDQMAKFPSCRTAIIFHESGGGPFPMELLGEKTEISEDQKKRDIERVKTALTTAKAWREVDPGIRLIIGNSGESLGLLAQLFRENYPKDMIDAMGDESVGMTQPPERSTAYPAWALQKLAKIYGYDCKPDAPWEWKSRVMRHCETEENCAAVQVRDALIALAWRYTCVPLSGITEMANSYYDTIWGDAAFTRWPLAYPTQCFTAQSTLTLLLDSAKFVRMVPTGSLTTYCLEFQKPDGSFVYALWTARAKLPVAVAMGNSEAKKLTVIDMLGGQRKIEITESFEVGPSPCYIATEAAIAGVKIDPMALEAPAELPKGAQVVQSLTSPEEVEVRHVADKRIELKTQDQPFSAFHRAGEFHVEAGTNSVKLVRTTQEECPELMAEYTFLKFRNPKPVKGMPSTIGVAVKGNSSWGKLYFEITDAEGEVWLSAGTGGYGCEVYDWPEIASINFDGWQFVQFPITGASPVKVYSPGENEWQWQRDGESGNGKIDYPITVTGLGVGMYPRVLNLLEMEETAREIELKDLVVY